MSDVTQNIVQLLKNLDSAMYYFGVRIDNDQPEEADPELAKMEKALEAIKVDFITFRSECAEAEKARKALIAPDWKALFLASLNASSMAEGIYFLPWPGIDPLEAKKGIKALEDWERKGNGR